eukprot:3008441-Rhodomonas_salina.1
MASHVTSTCTAPFAPTRAATSPFRLPTDVASGRWMEGGGVRAAPCPDILDSVRSPTRSPQPKALGHKSEHDEHYRTPQD